MELVNTNGKLMTVSGNVYVVAPDIVVYYAKLFRTLLAGASSNRQKDLREKAENRESVGKTGKWVS